MPREVNILNPRSQEYFRRTREAALGHRLEDLLDGEDKAWQDSYAERLAVGELMRSNQADGPFILGSKPSLTDFFIAGALRSAKVIDESVWERMMLPGYKEVYEACLKYTDLET